MLIAAFALTVPAADGLTFVGRSPTQLDVRSTVTDARGTGTGWFLSVAAYDPRSSPKSAGLILAGATASCVGGSACTLPVNGIRYPATVTLTGTRAMVFEAEPSTGLGAKAVDFRVFVPSPVPSGLSLSFSISTQPSEARSLP